MKKLLIAGTATLAFALPGVATAQDTTPSPKTNAAKACKAERARMGVETFKTTYGTNKNGKNAFGKCVSKRTKLEKANITAAKSTCKAQRNDPDWRSEDGQTFAQEYGTNKNGKNAHGKCVSRHAKAESKADTAARVNAAKACKAERKADSEQFAADYGTHRNAFGKCVSAKAKAQQDDQPQS